MRPRDLPVIHGVIEAGPNDRVFDVLLLSGPLVVGLVALLGRENVVSAGVASAYLAAFCGYVLYKGFVSGE
ncbi:hypothetical protein BRD00_14055 [Halobacteriales archaeon QS_8_69_26]|nr:MAG: hypothetical protein BRD00_14055 [Halobacteriales archaeon QS_8_69_26]